MKTSTKIRVAAILVPTLLATVAAFGQVIYEPCTGPGCNTNSCLSLALCGTGGPLNTSPDGCIAKQGNALISTGVPCGTGGGGPGGSTQCTLPSVAAQVLVSNSSTTAQWVDVPDCSDTGALTFNQSDLSFSCVDISSVQSIEPAKGVRKVSASAFTNTTMTDVNEMTLKLLCTGKNYEIRAHLLVHTDTGASATTPGLQLAFTMEGTAPAGTVMCTSSQGDTAIGAPIGTALQNFATKSNGVNGVVECSGIITTGTGCTLTTGDFKMQAAQQNGSAKKVFIDAGSALVAERIP